MCLLLLAGAACGDSGVHAGSTAAAEVGKLTVSNSACIYEGSSTHVAGAVTILLVDQTGGGFNAYVWVLEKGYEYADLARGFLTEHATLRDHAQMVDHASVSPGATQRFKTHFFAGTQAFLCVPLRDGSEYGLGYTAGPITVTS
jgi:tRNA U38,U39,U40 pseudouridine synthase TruA